MSKLISMQDIEGLYLQREIDQARTDLREKFGLGIPQVWQVREQLRMNSNPSRWIDVANDNPLRFLHQSEDDPTKVAYTNNGDKGQQDIQTRTTLAAYCQRFELVVPSTDENRINTIMTSVAEYDDLVTTVKAYFVAKDVVNALEKKLKLV